MQRVAKDCVDDSFGEIYEVVRCWIDKVRAIPEDNLLVRGKISERNDECRWRSRVQHNLLNECPTRSEVDVSTKGHHAQENAGAVPHSNPCHGSAGTYVEDERATA